MFDYSLLLLNLKTEYYVLIILNYRTVYFDDPAMPFGFSMHPFHIRCLNSWSLVWISMTNKHMKLNFPT